MESGEAIEFEEVLQPKGSADADLQTVRHFMVLKFPLKDEAGKVIGLCGFSHDMTRVKEAEAALRASEERFRQLSEAALEGIVFHDGEVVVSANRTYARMFEYDPAVDLAGTPILDFVAPESHAIVRESVQTHSEVPYEIVGQRADGSRFPMEIIAREAPYQGGTARVVVVRDLTERKQAEQQRLELEREKDRAAVLQYFISDASHDLRTPLTTIKTSLHLLSHLDDPDRRARHLAILQTQTDHLERLLEQMLQMTRLDAASTFRFGPVDLNRLVELVFQQQQEEAARWEQAFQFIPDPNLPRVQADMGHLNRALTILVENALTFTPEGGCITIQTYRQDKHAIVKIEDNGIGIRAEDMQFIFDRFFRVDKTRSTESGGAGLGLSIAKKIVEAHQGTIEADSTLGEGSTFWVRLPIT
jgi:two-component system sensor histidine kinase/response regulator